MDSLLELPLAALTTIVPSLLLDVDSQVATAELLFARLPLCEDDEIKAILNLMCMNCSPTPLITLGLMNMLECVNPLLIVEVVPQLCGNTPAEVAVVVEAFKNLVDTDRTFLPPVLGALGQLNLPKALAQEVFDLARESLGLVDENDTPAVIKCLMQTVAGKWDSNQAVVLIDTLRSYGQQFTKSTLVLVLGILQVIFFSLSLLDTHSLSLSLRSLFIRVPLPVCRRVCGLTRMRRVGS